MGDYTSLKNLFNKTVQANNPSKPSAKPEYSSLKTLFDQTYQRHQPKVLSLQEKLKKSLDRANDIGTFQPARPVAPAAPSAQSSSGGIGFEGMIPGASGAVSNLFGTLQAFGAGGKQAEYAAYALGAQALYKDAEEQAKQLQQTQEQLRQLETRRLALENSGRYLQQLYAQYMQSPNDTDYMTYMSAYEQYQAAMASYNEDAAAAEKGMAAYNKDYAKYAETIQKAQEEQGKADALYDLLYPRTEGALATSKEELSQLQAKEASAAAAAYGQRSLLPNQGQAASASAWATATHDNDLAAIKELHDRDAAYEKARRASEYLRPGVEYAEAIIPYEKLRDNPDFAEKSKFVSKKTGEPKYNTAAMAFEAAAGSGDFSVPMSSSGSAYYSSTGYDSEDDLEYDYINGDPQAVMVVNSREQGTTHFVGADSGEKQYLTDEEIQIYNYLYNTQGSEAAGAYLDTLETYLNQRERQAEELQWREMAKKDPVGASFVRLATSPVKGLVSLAQIADYIGDGKIDQNSSYNRLAYRSSVISDEVSKNIEASWGPVGSFAYNVGMSSLEFLLANALSGGVKGTSLALMGSGAMADTVITAKDRGYSDGDAILLGLIAGATEAVTENLSIDKLFDWKSLRNSTKKYILQNVLSEGSEEAVSRIVNSTFDYLIAQDQSIWMEQFNAYKSQGLSDGEAVAQLVIDELLATGVDFLSGAVSGGILSGGSAVMNSAQASRIGKKIKKTDSGVQTLIELSLASKDADVRAQAEALQQELAKKNAMDLSSVKVGNLHVSYMQAIGKNSSDETAAPQQPADTEAAKTPAAETAGTDIKVTSGTDENGYTTLTAEAPGAAESKSPAPAVEWAGSRTTETGAEPVKTTETAAPRVVNMNSTSGIRWAGSELEQLENRGAILTGDSVNADPALQEEVQRIAKTLGREIEVFRQTATDSGIIDGIYDPRTGKLYVNAESSKPAARIIGHELTHAAELGEAYQLLAAFVRKRVQKTDNNWQRLREAVEETYAKNGVELTSEQVDQEVVAEYIAQHLLTDEAAIRELVKERPSLGRRIWNWLKNLLTKLPKKSSEWRFVNRAMELYRNALAESEAVRSKQAEGLRAKEELDQRYRAGELTDEEHSAEMDVIEQEYDLPDNFAVKYSFADENAKTAAAAADASNLDPQTVDDAMPADPDGAETDAAVNWDEWVADAKSVLNSVPSQAQSRLSEDLKSLWRSLREAVAFPIYADNSVLKDAARLIAADVVDSGYLNTDWVSRVFDVVYDRMMDQVLDYNSKYPGILDLLRGSRVSISEDAQKNWDGYQRLKKRSHNKILQIADSGGTDVNTFYSELQARAPELFPASATSEEAKLKRLFSVSMDLLRAEFLLKDTVENERFAAGVQRAIRNDFVKAAVDAHTPLRQVSRYATEARQNAFKPLEDEAAASEAQSQFEAAARNLREVEQSHLLTAQDRAMVLQLLTGGVDSSALSALDPSVAAGIRAVYQARLRYDKLSAQLREWNERKAAGETTTAEPVNQEDPEAKPVEAKLTKEQADAIIAAVPKKAKIDVMRFERDLTPVLEDAAKMPRHADPTTAAESTREIIADMLQNGSASQQSIDHAFQQMYDAARSGDAAYAEKYTELGQSLRTLPITASEEAQAAFGYGYNKWLRYAKGVLRIVQDGGTDVNTVYEQLSTQYPELFPADITKEASRMKRLYSVSRGIIMATNMSQMSDEKLSKTFRAAAKSDFESAVRERASSLTLVLRYLKDVNDTAAEFAEASDAEEPEEIPLRIKNLDDLKQANADLKKASRAKQRASAKHLLTRSDMGKLGMLMRGELRLDELDPNSDNVAGITEVYRANVAYDQIARDIDQWKAKRKEQMREAADKLMQNALYWKDKKAGWRYSRETMERNIRDIVGDDELAQQIIDAYFTPVHEAVAKATRMKNEYRDRVKALKLSRKVLKGNLVSESHAVQLLGEAMDNIRRLETSTLENPKIDGKTLKDWQAIVDNIWIENPGLNRVKVEQSVETFRQIYDELFEQMNETRLRNGYEPVSYRKGYFPHFQPQQSGLADLFARALGIEMNVTELPTSINGLTHRFRPGIQWFGNTLERLGFQTAYDAVEGFDRYIEGAANVVHITDSIQNLRALAAQIRYRATDAGIQKQVDDTRKRDDLSEEEKDILIKNILDNAKHTLSFFVAELDEYTNKLAGKKSLADRSFEASWGRKAYNLIKWWENRVAANLVGLNPGSWLTNFAPLAQGWQDLGRYVISGMWDTMANLVNHDDMNERSTFLTNRSGTDPLVQTWSQRASGFIGTPMELIDHFVSASLVRGRYQQNLKRGMSEASAMQEADAWVASVMADRSKGALPTLFERKNPLTKMFTQFQTEVNNEFSYIFKDMRREMKGQGVARAAMILFRFLIGRWIFNEMYEALIGRRPMLDPLNMLLDLGFDWAGYERQNLIEEALDMIFSGDDFELWEKQEKSGFLGAAGGLLSSAAESLPFVGNLFGGGRLPVGNSLPDFSNIVSAIGSDRLGNVIWDEMSKLLYNVAFPLGGGQMKKIFQGIEAVYRGGSYTVDSEGNDILQYPVSNDTWQDATKNLLQATIFGKSSLDEATDWVDSGFKSLNAKETAVYQGMLDAGVISDEAFAFVQELKGAEKTDTLSREAVQKQMLLDSDLSGAAKSVVYYGLFTAEGENGPDTKRALMNALVDTADMGAVTETMLQLDLADATMTKGAAREERNIIAASKLTEEEKLTTWRYILGSKDKETGIYSLSDDVEADLAVYQNAGLTMDQYVDAMHAKEDILAAYKGDTDRELNFYKWVSEQGYTPKEAKAVRGCFYSGKETKYDEFLAGGISHDKAYQICKKLAALEPLDGKKQVSDMQRYEAVLSVNMPASQQMDAMAAVMDKDAYPKLEVAYQYDIAPSVYVQLKKLAAEAEADSAKELKSFLKSVGTSNAGAIQWAGGLTLTRQQKAVIWQIFIGKKQDGGDNPFDRKVGREVYAMLYPEEEK